MGTPYGAASGLVGLSRYPKRALDALERFGGGVQQAVQHPIDTVSSMLGMPMMAPTEAQRQTQANDDAAVARANASMQKPQRAGLKGR